MKDKEKSRIKPPLPQRFYRTAKALAAPGAETLEAAQYAVLLDGRGVKTPLLRPLLLPSPLLAEWIAEEFQQQKQVINPALMPITRLANTVIDGIKADFQPLQEDILRYLSCDTVFYRAESPKALADRQNKSWDKALDWALIALKADFQAHNGVMFQPQKPEALAAAAAYLHSRINPHNPDAAFTLAALHMMTALTGSALLAFMAEAGAMSAEDAWQAAHIEEDWTAEQWGKDAEAETRRRDRGIDFFAAARVAAALSR